MGIDFVIGTQEGDMGGAPKMPTHEECWTDLPAAVYEAAVYDTPVLLELFRTELDTTRDLLQPGDVLIEIGCGTGKFCREFVGIAGTTIIGVDISRRFLNHFRDSVDHRQDVLLLESDACHLTAALARDPILRTALHHRRRVVACVMNTLGIMPTEIRPVVLREMSAIAGPTGDVLIVVFEAAWFQFGVREFYRKNPQLCGEIEDADVDERACELAVRSTGYYSHWFKEDELAELAAGAGIRDVAIRRTGLGLILLGRGGPPERNLAAGGVKTGADTAE